jgi:hypothetical protein
MKTCQTPGHEDRPATVSLRLPGMDDWPDSPNVCGPCADEAMYPLAVKAARAHAALMADAAADRVLGPGTADRAREAVKQAGVNPWAEPERRRSR